jgi:hypothetical protein
MDAYIDLSENRCHAIAEDRGDELTAICGQATRATNARRVSRLIDGQIIAGCRTCIENGGPWFVGGYKSVVLPMSHYETARERHAGFCTNCRQITNSGVEPDGRGYKCDQCGLHSVYGIEEVLFLEIIEVEPA